MRRYLQLFIFVAILGAGCDVGADQTSAIPGQPVSPASKSSPNTSELDLSGRGLAAIPLEIFSRTHLLRLDLSHNKLTGAPQSQIGQLKNLVSLDLSNNSLTGLPAELGQLSTLEVLNVSNNRLTGLPMELQNLTQLRVFDISGNPYSSQDLDQIAKKLPNTEIRR